MEAGSPTREALDIRDEYADWDFSIPPFEFPTHRPDYQSPSPYLEVDETAVFKMQDRVFHPQEFFPQPSDELSETHPVRLSWEKLLRAHKDLTSGIDLTRTMHDFLRNQPDKISNLSREVREVLGLEREGGDRGLARSEKGVRFKHFHEKRLFFQRALAYLLLYQCCPDFKEKDPASKDLLDEVEAMYLGHIGLSIVKSAAHKFGERREDGTPVFFHYYYTCIYLMNRYLEEIHTCSHPQKRRKLYQQMKKGILVALGHDYLEDFEHLSEQFFEDKLTEYFTFDTDIEGDIREAGYKGIPPISSFFKRHRQEILRMFRALRKPPPGDARRKTYLERQLQRDFTGNKADRACTFRVKTGDRLNNLNTLEVKPVEKQVSYIAETRKIIELGDQIHKLCGGELDVEADIRVLCKNVLSQIDRLLTDHQEGLSQTGQSTILESERQRISNLLSRVLSTERSPCREPSRA